MPAFNQGKALVIARLRRVEQSLRRMTVHHHLTPDHAHAAPFGFRKHRLSTCGMNRTIGHACGRPVSQEPVIKSFRHCLAMRHIRKALLFHKRIFVEPIKQIFAPARQNLHLREMEMHINEARQNQMRSVVHNMRAMDAFAHIIRVSHSHNTPVPDVHSPRLVISKCRLIMRALGATVKAQHAAKK